MPTADLEIYKNNLLKTDPYNTPLEGKDSANVLELIQEKKFYAFKKIADKGDQLFFTIKAGKRTNDGGYAIQCEFTVSLLSDLYMYWKFAESTYGLVFSCPCVVEERYGSIENFEPIYAYSLNDSYTKTFEWYFGLYGKSTTNIYNSFWILDGKTKKLLAQVRMKRSTK